MVLGSTRPRKRNLEIDFVRLDLQGEPQNLEESVLQVQYSIQPNSC